MKHENYWMILDVLSSVFAAKPQKAQGFINVRKYYNEEYCYIMDAKSIGNIGRYLNVSIGRRQYKSHCLVALWTVLWDILSDHFCRIANYLSGQHCRKKNFSLKISSFSILFRIG